MSDKRKRGRFQFGLWTWFVFVAFLAWVIALRPEVVGFRYNRGMSTGPGDTLGLHVWYVWPDMYLNQFVIEIRPASRILWIILPVLAFCVWKVASRRRALRAGSDSKGPGESAG
jgi:hypothetical protein